MEHGNRTWIIDIIDPDWICFLYSLNLSPLEDIQCGLPSLYSRSSVIIDAQMVSATQSGRRIFVLSKFILRKLNCSWEELHQHLQDSFSVNMLISSSSSSAAKVLLVFYLMNNVLRMLRGHV